MPVPSLRHILGVRSAGPLLLACLTAAGLASPNLRAETEVAVETTAQPIETVTISELKNPLAMSGRAVLNAQEAFRRHQPQLAPGTELHYRLLPRQASPDARPLVLKIETEGLTAAQIVPLSADLSFQLPSINPAQAGSTQLILNRKKGQMDWWPHIRAPQADPSQVRLGNLKLECEVFWAGVKTEMPLVMRGMLFMVDLCKSPRVQVEAPAPRRLKAATVKADGKTWQLRVWNDGWTYVLPLTDARLNNDSVIEFTFAEDEGTPPKHRLSLHMGMSKLSSSLREVPPETPSAQAKPAAN